ncbi:MAG TPA: sulfite exporter TauE/SafE family protein [Candidatus Saccharimonadales bacterium]
MGIVVGAMNAIAGGGGLIGFPVLLSVGLRALTADATSYIAVLPGQIASAFSYRRYIAKVPKMYWLLLIPCAGGTIIGSQLLRTTSFSDFDKLVPFLVLLSVVIFALQPLLHFNLLKHLRASHKSTTVFFFIAFTMFLATIYSGYFSVGLGLAILVPLGMITLHEVHTLNAIKALVAITVIVVALAGIFSAHIINWHYGLIVAGGNVIGGYFGARFAQKVSSHYPRIVVTIIGVLTAAYLAWRYH